MDTSLPTAVLQTLHYADVFDYPLTVPELHRYLIGYMAAPADVAAVVDALSAARAVVVSPDGYVTLPCREVIVAERRQRAVLAQPMRRDARFYARLLSALPFVRMVALTGSLAMDNARDGDIDYLIVCAPGRLWLARGMAVLLVRIAALRGTHLCPNYLLSEDTLTVEGCNLYNAHELVQMEPYYGRAVHARMLSENAWYARYLPNAICAGADREPPVPPALAALKRLGERVLAGRFGDALERWEMTRKVRKLAAQAPPGADDPAFTPDVCRGFFGGYGRRVLAEYARRTRPIPVPSPETAATPAWHLTTLP